MHKHIHMHIHTRTRTYPTQVHEGREMMDAISNTGAKTKDELEEVHTCKHSGDQGEGDGVGMRMCMVWMHCSH